MVVVIGALILGPALAWGEPAWTWIAGDTTPSGWFTTKGSAEVEVTGARLRAKLYDGDRLAQTLEGTVVAGKVDVVRRVHNSDLADERMTGTYARGRHRDAVFETILVHTRWGFVGVTRTVPPRQDR